MTTDDLNAELDDQTVQQRSLAAGDRVTFYATSTDESVRTGEQCTVIGPRPLSEYDHEESEPMWVVAFDDETRLDVFEGEINGFYLATNQYIARPGEKDGRLQVRRLDGPDA